MLTFFSNYRCNWNAVDLLLRMRTKQKAKSADLKPTMSQRWTAKTCWSAPTVLPTRDRRLTLTKNRTTPTRALFRTSLRTGSRTPRGTSSGRQRCYQIIRNLKISPIGADRPTATMYKLPPYGYNVLYVSMHVTCFMTICF